MERFDITIQMYSADASGTQYVWEKVPAEEGDFVLYADAQATIAALQARVQELEAIKTPDDAFTYCAYCGEKSPVDEHNEDLAAHIKICPKHPMRDVESQLTQRTAELERVRGELQSAEAGYFVAERELQGANNKYDELHTLIAALPKVEGEIEVSSGVYNFILLKHDSGTRFLCGQIETEQTAKAYAALLQHRQGMEG